VTQASLSAAAAAAAAAAGPYKIRDRPALLCLPA
jgi:hypothetical protein